MVIQFSPFDRIAYSSADLPWSKNLTLLYDPFTTIHTACDVANNSIVEFTSFNVSSIERGETFSSILDMMTWLSQQGTDYVNIPVFRIGADYEPPGISSDGTLYEIQLHHRQRRSEEYRLQWECVNSTWNDAMRSDVCPLQAGRVDPMVNMWRDYVMLDMPPAPIGSQMKLRFTGGVGRRRIDEIVTFYYVDPMSAVFFSPETFDRYEYAESSFSSGNIR